MNNKKFFTLISNSTIHVAPKSKIIPAADFSTALEAVEVLDLIKIEAEQYRQDVIKECELLKEQAQSEGFDAGLKLWSEFFADLENEKIQARKEMQEMVIPIALKAAKKIVRREIELSNDIIVDIVAGNIKPVLQHHHVTIYVNKQDVAILDENRQRLKDKFENLESFSIRERADIAQGGCVIETEKGIINAQIENLWRALEQAFEKNR